ncbi:MAG: hypothetical protein WC273_09855 [Dehalococcoidia bacterium]
MGTAIRWITLVSVGVLIYLVLTEGRQKGGPGVMGKLRLIGQKIRLVALLYVLAIVLSAAVRVLFGWNT